MFVYSMYVCVYVSTCMEMHVYVCIYVLRTYIYVWIYMYTHEGTCTRTCKYMCVCMCVNVGIYVCTCMYLCICVYMIVCICVYVYMCVRVIGAEAARSLKTKPKPRKSYWVVCRPLLVKAVTWHALIQEGGNRLASRWQGHAAKGRGLRAHDALRAIILTITQENHCKACQCLTSWIIDSKASIIN